MSVNLGSAYGEIVLDSSGVSSGVRSAQSEISTLSGAFDSVGREMMGVGKTMTATVTAPILGIATAAAKTAGDFESQMNVLSIAARQSGTSLEELRSAAIAVGADTELVGISAAEAADAMTGFYKAGLDTTDIFGDLNGYLEEGESLTGALRAAVDLAAASDLDLASASDAVAIAMATFGMSAEDATAIADSFVGAADASVAEVGDLTAAMVNVGPTAAAFGWSLEDVNTALALLSERGITGAEAGTALKSMMTNLMRPTDDVVSTLQDLNVELYNADGTMKGLPEIMAQLEGGMAGLSEEQRNMAVQTLAGTYGMKAMNTLLAEGSDGWTDMEDAIAAAATAQEVGAARTKGFSASMEQLKGTIETLLIEVGTPLIQNFLTPLAEKLTELLGGLLEQDTAWIGWALAIGGVLAVAGPLMMGIGAIITVIGALLSPIGLVVAAVAGLALAFATNFGGIRDMATGLWEQLQVVWAGIQTAIATAIEWITPYVQEFVATMRGWFEENWPAIQAVFEQVWNNILAVVEYVVGLIVPFVQENLGMIVAWIQENWPLILQTIQTVMSAILGAVQGVLGWIQTAWQTHGQQILAFVEAAWNAITTAVQTAIDAVLGIIKAVMQAINGDWEGAWETIKETAAEVWEGIKEAVGSAVEALHEALALVWDVIQPALSDAWDAIKRKAEEVWEAIERWITDRVEAMQQAIERVWTEVNDWLSGIWNGLKETSDRLWATVQTGIANAGDIIREWTGKIAGWFGGIAGAISDVIGKIGAFITKIKELAEQVIPSWLLGESPPPLATWIEYIGQAALLTSDQLNLMGMELEQLSKLGSGLSSFSSYLVRLFKGDRLDPLAERLEGLDDQLAAMRDEGEWLTVGGMAEYLRLMDERNALADEYAQEQAKILELQEKQQQLQFLQQQLKLLDMLNEYGLDASDVLAGITLGLDASIDDMIAAMTAAMAAVVGAVEDELGIHSPSRVFMDIIRQAMEGAALGAERYGHLPAKAVVAALSAGNLLGGKQWVVPPAVAPVARTNNVNVNLPAASEDPRAVAEYAVSRVRGDLRYGLSW